jgi:hypothetical protein
METVVFAKKEKKWKPLGTVNYSQLTGSCLGFARHRIHTCPPRNPRKLNLASRRSSLLTVNPAIRTGLEQEPAVSVIICERAIREGPESEMGSNGAAILLYCVALSVVAVGSAAPADKDGKFISRTYGECRSICRCKLQ